MQPVGSPIRKLLDEYDKIEREITSYRIQIRISKIVIKNPDEYFLYYVSPVKGQ